MLPVQLDQSTDVYGIGRAKIPERQRLKLFNTLFNLGGLARLPTGKIRGFQAPGVILVLGLALLVSRFGVRRTGGLEEHLYLGGQLLDDLVDQLSFVHWGISSAAGVVRATPSAKFCRGQSLIVLWEMLCNRLDCVKVDWIA